MPAPAEHVIGFPRESTPGDRRTLLTPHVAGMLRQACFTIIAEVGIGAGVFCDDADLVAEGVRFAEPSEAWTASLVLRYKSANPAEHLGTQQFDHPLLQLPGPPATTSPPASSSTVLIAVSNQPGRFRCPGS